MSETLYSADKDDNLQHQRRLEASSNAAGPSLRNVMMRSSTFVDRKLRYCLGSCWFLWTWIICALQFSFIIMILIYLVALVSLVYKADKCLICFSVHITVNLTLLLHFGEGAGEGSLLNKGLQVQGNC